MKKPFHFYPKISCFSKVKIVRNTKTVELFYLIFVPSVNSSPQLSITNEKPAKILKNTLKNTYHKNLYIIYIRNAKTRITQKPFNISTQFFFLGPFPLLSYPLLLPNHPKSSKKSPYKERRSLRNHVSVESQSFKRQILNFDAGSIFLWSTLPK